MKMVKIDPPLKFRDYYYWSYYDFDTLHSFLLSVVMSEQPLFRFLTRKLFSEFNLTFGLNIFTFVSINIEPTPYDGEKSLELDEYYNFDLLELVELDIIYKFTVVE